MEVVGSNDAPLGKVVEVVNDTRSGQPAFVVISSQGRNVAVPYAAATSMLQGNRLIMDQARLEKAPRVRQGEWRDTAANATWRSESERYWRSTRSASGSSQTEGSESPRR